MIKSLTVELILVKLFRKLLKSSNDKNKYLNKSNFPWLLNNTKNSLSKSFNDINNYLNNHSSSKLLNNAKNNKFNTQSFNDKNNFIINSNFRTFNANQRLYEFDSYSSSSDELFLDNSKLSIANTLKVISEDSNQLNNENNYCEFDSLGSFKDDKNINY